MVTRRLIVCLGGGGGFGREGDGGSVAASWAQEFAEDFLREGHPTLFGFELAERLRFGDLPSRGESGGIDHHVLLCAGKDLQFAPQPVLWSLVEAGDLKTEVLVFLSISGTLFVEILNLFGIKVQLVAEVALVATKLALGFPMVQNGDHQENSAEGKAHSEGIEGGEEIFNSHNGFQRIIYESGGDVVRLLFGTHKRAMHLTFGQGCCEKAAEVLG